MTTRRPAMADAIHAPRATAPVAPDCLGRTCMKWSADGELTSLDLLLVLERLARVDQELTGLCLDSLVAQPCPSLN